MKPVTLEITLDLSDHLARHVGYDEDGEPSQEPMTVEDLVLGLAARKLVDQLLGSTARFGKDDPARAVRQTILSKAEEMAAERVEGHVEAAFEQLIHETTDDGREVLSHTLRDAIVKATEAATKLRSTDERSRGFRTNLSVLEKLVTEHVDRTVEREVKKEIESAKEKVRGEVSRKAADAIAKALT